jgi:IPT/TIG domain
MSDLANTGNGDLAVAAPGRYGDADDVHAGNGDLAYDGAAGAAPPAPVVPPEPEPEPPPGPRLDSADPASGPVAGGTEVTLAGAGLSGTTAVWFGARWAQSAVLSDSGVTATSPAAADAGAVDVRAVTADGDATLASGFTYTGSPEPEG